jgi:HEPN domain-containing protein
MASHVKNRMATECYRNVADRDYISARMGFRLGFVESYLWGSIKAVEKYLKAILIYNGRNSVTLSHNLRAIRRQVEGVKEIQFKAGRRESVFMEHLNAFCEGEKLDRNMYKLPKRPTELDHTVWSIRRYCMCMQGTSVDKDGSVIDLFKINLQNIKSEYYMEHPADFKIAGGFLEEVIHRDPADPLRKSLLWKNQYYCGQEKRKVKKSFFAFPEGASPGKGLGRLWSRKVSGGV